MNAIDAPNVFFRSLATRGGRRARCPTCLPDVIAACQAAGFDLVIVETPGIGQGDAAITALVDVSLYVMTPEFGAASQLEKIDMLDFADASRSTSSTGAAARTPCATCAASWPATASCSTRRPRTCRSSAPSRPGSTTTASPRCTSTCAAVLGEHGLPASTPGVLARSPARRRRRARRSCPGQRVRYLAEIAGDGARLPRATRERRPRSPAGGRPPSRPLDAARRADPADASRSVRLPRRRDAELTRDSRAAARRAWPALAAYLRRSGDQDACRDR